jgi:glutamine---fructose-6-phosphate transaminase (isomerizing)
METCSVAASGWSAADAKHGPLGQAVEGTPVFCLTSSAGGSESVRALIPDFEAKGARVFVIGPEETATGTAHPFSDVLPGGIADDAAPLLEIVPFQLLALELSVLLGRDPDRPAGLSKVTLTT